MQTLRLMLSGVVYFAIASIAMAFAEPVEKTTVDATAVDTTVTATTIQPEPAIDEVVKRTIGSLDWHTDYKLAYREAKAQKKFLLVYFRDEAQGTFYDSFEKNVLADATAKSELERVVRVVVPSSSTDYGRKLKNDSRERLLDHPSFSFMYRTAGLAMIDLASQEKGLHGHVVSAHPLMSHRSESAGTLRVLLTLPPGSVTQRAMIYAMRIHHSRPLGASHGAFSGYVGYLANHHSILMTSYGVGHHDWGNRANQVQAATGRSPTEVAAATGNSYLLDAAYQLITQWQNSPTHWGMMSPPASVYALDMVQSPSGGWFGTGIFAR